MEIFLVITAFIALAVISGIVSHRKKQARITELSAWARSRELQFQADEVHGFDDDHPRFECLQQGNNRYAFNVVSGKRGEHFLIAFDYHYETESTDSDGKSSTSHHYFSALMLQPRHRLKPLVIRREGFFDKLKAGFGFKDINFESAEFSKKFYVTAPDKRWAYEVINTRTMQLILDQIPKYQIEFDHEVICIAAEDELDAFGFEQAYLFASQILDGIPEFARQD
ncbi:MAG: hypothetical protein ACI8XO_000877 [Verrucomicrobiales bacterium]|jgi:hypothetical protein